MSVAVISAALKGLEAAQVFVEVDSLPGLHFFSIVGLPDKSVEESKDRIDSAIRNSGFISPKSKNLRLIVNLAPADVKKEGSLLDLPIALGYLAISGQIKANYQDRLFVGELSLEGSLRPIRGTLSIALLAHKHGYKELIVPKANAKEAAMVKDLRVVGVDNLKSLVLYLQDQISLNPEKFSAGDLESKLATPEEEFDFGNIKGQETAKRALIIAAAGGHNVLMFGPPGSGKTILSRALRSILPPMSYEEALEVTRIYSVAGLINDFNFITQRPFRSPHHTTAAPAIIGGGNIPHPGEVSLAHRGVLFLDELPEFPRNVLESLRQPMEDGEVTVSRASGSGCFPAKFMLIGSMNPCPCGNFGSEKSTCSCLPGQVYKYRKRISGPLLDRIDLQIFVPQETYDHLSSAGHDRKSAEIRDKVKECKDFQKGRLEVFKAKTNAEIGFRNIHKACPLSPSAQEALKRFVDKNNISGRGYHRTLKVSRTIADLDSNEVIQERHIKEAMGFRVSPL